MDFEGDSPNGIMNKYVLQPRGPKTIEYYEKLKQVAEEGEGRG
jgi:hypothetical protein